MRHESLEFLPVFEELGFVPEGQKTQAGRLPNGSEVPETSSFNMTLYTTGVIYPFDWSSWRDEAERLFNEPAALDKADESTLRKLLTFQARLIALTKGISTR